MLLWYLINARNDGLLFIRINLPFSFSLAEALFGPDSWNNLRV